MVTNAADSLEFEQKHRSIVDAWAPEDEPTDTQNNAVLDQFERTARASLKPDNSLWTAALHYGYGWNRPDEPAPARTHQSGRRACMETALCGPASTMRPTQGQ